MGEATMMATAEVKERMLRPKTGRWFRLDGRPFIADGAAPSDKPISDIIKCLTERGEQFAHMIWVGRNYSKADLLRDLRAIEDKAS